MKQGKLILILTITMFWLMACNRVVEMQVDALPVSVTDSTEEAATPPPVAVAGKTVVADGQLASLYPNLALGFGGGVSGEVLEVNVRAGDSIAAGAVLAVLNDADLQRAVNNAQQALDRAILDREQAVIQWERDVAEAEQSLLSARRAYTSTQLQFSNTALEETRTALARAQKAEDDAKKTYETPVFGDWTPPEQREREYNNWQNAIRERELAELRLDDALDTRAANALDLESRASDVAQAERKLAALQDGVAPSYQRAVEDAERELVKAQEALAHARLEAPWDAIVLSVDVAPKSTISAGAPVVTLLNVEDGLRFITQNLSEQHVASILPGQQANVTLRTYPEETFTGIVEAVIPQTAAKETTDARFAVRIRLDPTDLNLLPGLTGRVEIFAETE